jgi:hypothetical protein
MHVLHITTKREMDLLSQNKNIVPGFNNVLQTDNEVFTKRQ